MADITKEEILERLEAVERRVPASVFQLCKFLSGIFKAHLIGTGKPNPVDGIAKTLRGRSGSNEV
jgi:hypothetical protein